MLKKGNKLNSILTGSCPKCHEESMYVTSNPYDLKNLYNMHESCSHCHTVYKMEPSFFYGAMYVSYGLTVALGIATFLISHYLFHIDLLSSFFVIFGVLILLTPITFRLARNIYINLFIHYNPDWKSEL
jgi:uncharacterized protein (DUF983 family)